MAYHQIVKNVPEEKRNALSDRLVDIILKSKQGEKMPSSLAKEILNHWRQGPLTTNDSLAELLEAAVLIEPDSTIDALEQKLQLEDLAKAMKRISA